MTNDIIHFKSEFKKRFIAERSKQYRIPIDFCERVIYYCEDLGFDVLNPGGRDYIDNALLTNALCYHTGGIV